MTRTQKYFPPILTAAGAALIVLAALGLIGCSTAPAADNVFLSNNAGMSNEQTADAKFEQDRQAILSMAGQYAVTFEFEEKMAVREGYELKKPYKSAANEMVVIVEDTGDYIALQHLLVVSHGGETHVIKHWRQDWKYQAQQGYSFQGNNVWEPVAFDTASNKGAWVQSVYQVDDSPRYWGVGRWTHRDGVSSWISGPTNRPLPRREYSKRKDYQILAAVNTHVVTQDGWVHYQHNHKLDKEHPTQPVIALEVGVNTYTRTTETDFSAAQDYWDNTEAYWAEVRGIWSEIYGQHKTLKLKKRWKGDAMYSHIFDLADEYWGQDDVDQARNKVRGIIDAFMEKDAVALP